MIGIKLIGLGNRGIRTLERYRYIPTSQAVFTELVDTDPARVAVGHNILAEQGRPITPLSEKPEVELSYICTDWASHALLAVEEMRLGRDVAVEVPAAMTLEECQLLRDVARQTGRRCLMAENCCYDAFHLACLEMARQGLFGTLTHLEGAYIHTLGEKYGDVTKPWMLSAMEHCPGNSYPTHAYGPMAQFLALDGDGLAEISTLHNKIVSGINTAVIRSRRGRTVLLCLDVVTPRPYSRMQTVCGTDGYAQKYPLPTLWLKGMEAPVTGDEALRLADKYLTGELAEYWREGHRMGVPNEMNYTMDRRMLHCLATGERFEIEVDEAAEWSSLVALTSQQQSYTRV